MAIRQTLPTPAGVLEQRFEVDPLLVDDRLEFVDRPLDGLALGLGAAPRVLGERIDASDRIVVRNGVDGRVVHIGRRDSRGLYRRPELISD